MDWTSAEFWSQGWWQGIGAMAGFLIGATGVLVALRQNKKKRLSYEVIYSETLVRIDNNVKKDLKITYLGHEVGQLNILKVKIINNGSLPIRSSDFEGKIEITIENIRSLISYEITDTKPSNLEILGSIENGKFQVFPLLLNVGEYFTVQLIFDGHSRDFIVASRIEGITEIKNITITPPQDINRFKLHAVAFSLLLLFWLSRILKVRFPDTFRGIDLVLNNFSFTMAGASLGVLINMFVTSKGHIKYIAKRLFK